MSLIAPEIGDHSYFSKCSCWVVSQIRTFPLTSAMVKQYHQNDHSKYIHKFGVCSRSVCMQILQSVGKKKKNRTEMFAK